MYVGRISSDFTRRDLRHQFERFGEIEDVSVHFREHGGLVLDRRLSTFFVIFPT